ncbi:hypothetical protein H5410_004649, partial [Solanum commersonii]
IKDNDTCCGTWKNLQMNSMFIIFHANFYLILDLSIQRRTIGMVMINKCQTKVVEQSYLQHLQLKSLGLYYTKLYFVLLLTSTYYELFELYMHTLFELTIEASNNMRKLSPFKHLNYGSSSNCNTININFKRSTGEFFFPPILTWSMHKFDLLVVILGQ